MLYTVEVDTAPGTIAGAFDVAAIAQALEDAGAMDAVVSVGQMGDLGFTAQWMARTAIDASMDAEDALLTLLDPAGTMERQAAYSIVTAVSAYLTPVLEDVIEAAA